MNNPRLVSVHAQAREILNSAGAIRGQTGEENVRVIRADALNPAAGRAWKEYV